MWTGAPHGAARLVAVLTLASCSYQPSTLSLECDANGCWDPALDYDAVGGDSDPIPGDDVGGDTGAPGDAITSNADLDVVVCPDGTVPPDCTSCPEGHVLTSGGCLPGCDPGAQLCPSHQVCVLEDTVETCICESPWIGADCTQCADGFLLYAMGDTCVPNCEASGRGCVNGTCVVDEAFGVALCECTAGYIGDACDVCEAGYQDPNQDGVCSETCEHMGWMTCGIEASCFMAMATEVTSCGCLPGYQDANADKICAPTCAQAGIECGPGVCQFDLDGEMMCECDTDYQDLDGDLVCTVGCGPSFPCTGGTCVVDLTTGLAECTCGANQQDNNHDGTCEPSCEATGCLAGEACDDRSGTALCGCVFYADAAATDTGDGLTWGTAFNTLDEAVAAADVAAANSGSCQVWVAAGTYTPVGPLLIDATVEIYGGFAPGAGSLFDRDPNGAPTVIDGQGALPHVFVIGGTGQPILDGVRIVGGLAVDTTIAVLAGGGVLINGAQVSVRDCVFADNQGEHGGAIAVLAGELTVDDTVFVANLGPPLEGEGGAIYVEGGTATVRRSSFVANNSGLGGALYVLSSIVTVQQSNLVANSGNAAAVAFAGPGGELFIEDSKIASNFGTQGVLMVETGSLDVRNSLLIGNGSPTASTGIISAHGFDSDLLVNLVNDTMSHNHGQATALLSLDTGDAMWINNIDAGNVPLTGIAALGSATVSIGYSLLQSSGGCGAAGSCDDLGGNHLTSQATPIFRPGPDDGSTGSWSAVTELGTPVPWMVRIEVPSPLWVQGELRGMFLVALEVPMRPLPILSNEESSLLVLGTLDDIGAVSGIDFELIDFQLQPACIAIDSAWGDQAPELDHLGVRRLDTVGVPNIGAPTPDFADMGAFEFADPNAPGGTPVGG